MTIFEGNYSPKDLRIGIVVARFNEFINQKLLQGALDNLKRLGFPFSERFQLVPYRQS